MKTNKYIEEEIPKENQIENKFKLAFVSESTASLSKQFKQANLVLLETLDYEKLYKPNETLIRIDFSCSDGTFNNEAKLILQVEDLNDNRPKFLNSTNLVLETNETTEFFSIAKIAAYDMDSSRNYGNESLIYAISQCMPDVYGFYIDRLSGDIYSKFILDIDTDKIIESRANQFKENKSLFSFSNSIEIKCNVQVSDSYARNSIDTLSDEMNLTIKISNLNDNAPLISLANMKENTIEVKEGEHTRGMILSEIELFDRDDATQLDCLFQNGLSTYEVFEFKFSPDLTSPFKSWCILKVQDGMFISYDAIRKSSYLFDLNVMDLKQTPVYPNSGFSKVQINIRVIPVNNMPPTFVNGNEEIFTIFDSAKIGIFCCGSNES
jgi:hypothetical protein